MLTALKVAKAKADGKALRLGDGGGLYLLVRPTGSKAWVYRATVDGKRRDIGLGGFPAVGLAKARERAQEHREAVADGRNPIAERRRRAVPTFGAAVEAVFEANSHWSARHAETWRATLAKHAAPLWERPIDRIDRQDVLACLTPMWAEIAETGRRTRATLRQVMRWAIAHGYREDNPAGEAIEGALPRVRRHQVHHRALGYRDAPAAYEAIGTASAAALCLRFLMLTASRSGEARGATWAEIDGDAREWRIPAERMKARLPHRVPLSGAALAVLAQARAFNDGSGLVFPSPVKMREPVTARGALKALQAVADVTTVHGLRATFRDWAGETTGASWAAMEASLAHATGNATERAYARSDLFDQRRALMDAWGAFLIG